MTQNDPIKNTNTSSQQLILHFAEAKLGTQLAAPTKNKDHNPCKNVTKQTNISNPKYINNSEIYGK